MMNTNSAQVPPHELLAFRIRNLQEDIYELGKRVEAFQQELCNETPTPAELSCEMAAQNNGYTANFFANRVETLLANRGTLYDSPEGERSMQKIVAVFRVYTGHDLSVKEGWLFMDCLKTVRALQKNAFHLDSYEDKVTYSCLMAEAASQEQENPSGQA